MKYLGILHFFNANTFGGTAKIEFVYFTILCSDFVSFLQKHEIGKIKKLAFLAISQKLLEVKKCTMSQFNSWSLLFWPFKIQLYSWSHIFGYRKQNICALFKHQPLLFKGSVSMVAKDSMEPILFLKSGKSRNMAKNCQHGEVGVETHRKILISCFHDK